MVARRTQTKTLARDAPTTPPRWTNLLGYQDDHNAQRPRTLRVDVRALVPGMDDPDQRTAALAIGTCGVWWSSFESTDLPWHGGAALRIAYGSTPGISRTVYADLRSGEYAIPPCEAVSVSAAYWRPLDELEDVLASPPIEVAVEIADGDPGDCSPLTLTAWRRVDAGSSAPCSVPPGAYGFELLPGQLDHIAAACGGMRAHRMRAGAWTPPTTPILIAGADCRHVHVWTDDLLPGGGEGEGGELPAWTAGVVFYVR